jgi:hypothetical protein
VHAAAGFLPEAPSDETKPLGSAQGSGYSCFPFFQHLIADLSKRWILLDIGVDLLDGLGRASSSSGSGRTGGSLLETVLFKQSI